MRETVLGVVLFRCVNVGNFDTTDTTVTCSARGRRTGPTAASHPITFAWHVLRETVMPAPAEPCRRGPGKPERVLIFPTAVYTSYIHSWGLPDTFNF
jgi:hypothetical protein